MPNFINDTNRQGLIVWGGEASTDYGIVVGDAPAFDKPVRRETVFNVPGRNGSVLFTDGSFEDVVRSYSVWLAEDITEESGVYSGALDERIAAFTAWLYSKKGYQRLEDSFDPEFFRLAYYTGGEEIANHLMQYGDTTISFVCRPERFYKNAESAVEVSNGSTMTNPTKFDSKPLIHIEGSGNVSISISGVTMSATISDYINIDCDRMDAYRLPTENKNGTISGSFPVLKSGSNSIALTGTITKATIVPRYFTI